MGSRAMLAPPGPFNLNIVATIAINANKGVFIVELVNQMERPGCLSVRHHHEQRYHQGGDQPDNEGAKALSVVCAFHTSPPLINHQKIFLINVLERRINKGVLDQALNIPR